MTYLVIDPFLYRVQELDLKTVSYPPLSALQPYGPSFMTDNYRKFMDVNEHLPSCVIVHNKTVVVLALVY